MRPPRALAALVLVLAPTAAHAQMTYEAGFDPEHLQVSADPGSVALQDGARTLALREYAAGLALHLDGDPLDICVSDGEGGCVTDGDVINSQLRADVFAMIGLGRFDVRAMLPVVLHQSSDFGAPMGESGLSSTAVGDLRLGGRVHVLEARGVGVAGDVSFTIPIGGGSNFVGDSGTLVDPRAIVDWRSGRVSTAASLGYRYRQDPIDLGTLHIGNQVLWSVAGEYAVTPDKLSFGASVAGHGGVEAMATARYFVTDKIAIDAAVGTDVVSGYGAPPYRVLAGVRYVNRTKEKEPVIARIVAEAPPPEPEPAVVVEEPPPPEPEPVVEEPPPPEEPRAVVVEETSAVEISDKIYFDLNKATLKKKSHRVLDAVAELLLARTDLRVRVEGHTDDSGTETWNDQLSQARAESVMEYLISRGVDASRLEAVGYGWSRPLVEGKKSKARAKNRRVEFVIID